MNISVVIPVYKNTDSFLKNLKNNLPYLENCEIIIVNDDPEISIARVLSDYPNITLVENKNNLGFAKSVNIGVGRTHHPYVLLLNSDVLLIDDKFKLALKHFQTNPQLFAVSFAQKQTNNEIAGKNIYYWNRGFFQHGKSKNLKFGANAWAEGGNSIFDKRKFDILKGFDDLYSPFYWEDIDLSYRAWKNDYQIIFDPEIVVIHQHESTIGKYYQTQTIERLAFRNQLIFIWKNITDNKLLCGHLLLLLPRMILFTFYGKWLYWISLFDALKLIPKISRIQTVSVAVTDKQLLDKFHE